MVLKEKQKEAVLAILDGKDVFCVLPTSCPCVIHNSVLVNIQNSVASVVTLNHIQFTWCCPDPPKSTKDVAWLPMSFCKVIYCNKIKFEVHNNAFLYKRPYLLSTSWAHFAFTIINDNKTVQPPIICCQLYTTCPVHPLCNWLHKTRQVCPVVTCWLHTISCNIICNMWNEPLPAKKVDLKRSFCVFLSTV